MKRSPGPPPREDRNGLQDRLRSLHRAVGQPTLEELEAAADRVGAHLARSTAHDLLTKPAHRPRWKTVEAFVTACMKHHDTRSRGSGSDRALVANVEFDLQGLRELHRATGPSLGDQVSGPNITPRASRISGPSSDRFQRTLPAMETEPGPVVALGAANSTSTRPLLNRWASDNSGLRVSYLRDNRLSHPGFDGRGHTDEVPYIRLGMVVACERLGEDEPTTSQLRARALEFLRTSTVQALVMEGTTAGRAPRWQIWGGADRMSVAAVLAPESEGQQAPMAWARLLFPIEPYTAIGGRDHRQAGFFLHMEPRPADGSEARGADLAAWTGVFSDALALPAAFAGFLEHDLGLGLATDPAAQVGVWLNRPDIVVDTRDIEKVPGQDPVPWFNGYVTADPAGRPARAAARLLAQQLADRSLHLHNYEALLTDEAVALARRRRPAPLKLNHPPTDVPPTDVPRDPQRQADSLSGNMSRGDRLRDLCATLLRFALVLEGVCDEKRYLREGEDRQHRDDRHDRALAESQRQAAEMMPYLLIEPGLEGVVAAYKETYRKGDELLSWWRALRDMPGNSALEERRRLSDGLKAAVAELQDQITSALART